jgi:hypothetical protein
MAGVRVASRSMTLSDRGKDRAVGIALVLGVLIVIGVVFAHMLIDGNCDTTNTGFVGPDPNDAKACARTGGTWTSSTGFMHVAYEIGHIGFWLLIVVAAITAAFVLWRLRSPKPRGEALSQ